MWFYDLLETIFPNLISWLAGKKEKSIDGHFIQAGQILIRLSACAIFFTVCYAFSQWIYGEKWVVETFVICLIASAACYASGKSLVQSELQMRSRRNPADQHPNSEMTKNQFEPQQTNDIDTNNAIIYINGEWSMHPNLNLEMVRGLSLKSITTQIKREIFNEDSTDQDPLWRASVFEHQFMFRCHMANVLEVIYDARMVYRETLPSALKTQQYTANLKLLDQKGQIKMLRIHFFDYFAHAFITVDGLEARVR